MNNMKKVHSHKELVIAVFCSAYDLEEKYTKPAREFASLLAKNGYSLVWGGTDKGLMKIVADQVADNGGKIIGVSIPIFYEFARKNADEMILAKTLGQRKATMLERSDAVIALVGGIGTLDEITDIIELKRTKHHNKPIVILNTENFYEGLKLQFQKMKSDGFIRRPLNEILFFADTPKEAIEYINKALK